MQLILRCVVEIKVQSTVLNHLQQASAVYYEIHIRYAIQP